MNALRRLTSPSQEAASDADLIERFLTERCGSALETLVERHGPMVRQVCRRVLQNDADADDGCQATFLVLVQKARSIRKRSSLASWLYGVAYRIAVHARMRRARRREGEDCAMSGKSTQPDDPDLEHLYPALYAVLDALPEKYRAPLVLHYLEGKTLTETAAQLGWRAGTASSRMARGRRLLQDKLLRRGFTLSATFAFLHGVAPAKAIPTSLIDVTVRGALAFELGDKTLFTSQALTMAEGATRMMWLKRVQTLVVGGSAVLLLAVASTVSIFSTLNAKPGPTVDAVKPARIDCANSVWAISSDGRLAATASGRQIKIWDVATGRERHSFEHPGDCLVCRVRFLPDGRLLSTAKDVCLWDVRLGKKSVHLKGHEDVIVAVASSSDGKSLATAGMDSTIRLWDVASGKELAAKTLTRDNDGIVSSMEFSADGRWVACGTQGRTMRILQAATLNNHKTLLHVGRSNMGMTFVAFAPQGTALVSITDDTAQLWNAKTGERIGVCKGHEKTISAALFSNDGKTLATAGTDGMVMLWETATAKPRGSIKHATAENNLSFGLRGQPPMTFVDGDKYLVTAGDGIRRWDVAKRTEAALHEEVLMSASFTKDGRFVAGVETAGKKLFVRKLTRPE